MSPSLWHMLQSYCETSNFLKCLKNSRWAWHEKAKHHHLGQIPEEMYIAHTKEKKKEGKGKKDGKQSRLFYFLLRSYIPWTRKAASSWTATWTTLAPAPQEPGWCQGNAGRCFGKQQELQSLTQPAQHTEQNVSLMCNCCWCCKLRASAAPSPDLALKAQSSPWWLGWSAFYRAPFPLSLGNHLLYFCDAIFCTYSPIHGGAHVQSQNTFLFTADKVNYILGLFGNFSHCLSSISSKGQ